jgi:hypothetical protein
VCSNALGALGWVTPSPKISSANIDRWQNVPIPPLLALGTQALDIAAKVVGGPYRMIIYVQK